MYKFYLNFIDKEKTINEKKDSSSLSVTNIETKSEFIQKLEEVEKIEDRKIRAEEKSKIMPREYGYKYHGPEPTRYGDWEVKGKCSDF